MVLVIWIVGTGNNGARPREPCLDPAVRPLRGCHHNYQPRRFQQYRIPIFFRFLHQEVFECQFGTRLVEGRDLAIPSNHSPSCGRVYATPVTAVAVPQWNLCVCFVVDLDGATATQSYRGDESDPVRTGLPGVCVAVVTQEDGVPHCVPQLHSFTRIDRYLRVRENTTEDFFLFRRPSQGVCVFLKTPLPSPFQYNQLVWLLPHLGTGTLGRMGIHQGVRTPTTTSNY